jgi:hypothetical protein
LEKLAEAGEAYQQALNIRQELNQPRLALEALSGLARVSLAQGDRIQAQAHADQVLSSLEIHNLDGTQEPFRIYLTCYRVLRASDDPRADKILATAHGLLQERAAKIENEDLSRSLVSGECGCSPGDSGGVFETALTGSKHLNA